MSILRAFHDLVTTETTDAGNNLCDLRVMRGVRKFPQRVKCAMLAWRALEQALVQIDKHRLIERRAIEHQPHAGAFNGRAKDTG